MRPEDSVYELVLVAKVCHQLEPKYKFVQAKLGLVKRLTRSLIKLFSGLFLFNFCLLRVNFDNGRDTEAELCCDIRAPFGAFSS